LIREFPVNSKHIFEVINSELSNIINNNNNNNNNNFVFKLALEWLNFYLELYKFNDMKKEPKGTQSHKQAILQQYGEQIPLDRFPQKLASL